MKKRVLLLALGFLFAVLVCSFAACNQHREDDNLSKDRNAIKVTSSEAPSLLELDEETVHKAMTAAGYVKLNTDAVSSKAPAINNPNDNMKSVAYAYPSDWYTLDSLSRVQCLNNLYSEGRCASYSVLTFEENKLVCLTTFIYASKSKKVNQLVIFKEVSNSLYELLSKENISYEWKGFVYAYDEKERQYTNHDAYCTAIGGTTVGGTTEGGYVITASPMKGVAYMGFWVDGEAEKENDTMLSYWGVATTQFAHDQSPFYSFLPKP